MLQKRIFERLAVLSTVGAGLHRKVVYDGAAPMGGGRVCAIPYWTFEVRTRPTHSTRSFFTRLFLGRSPRRTFLRILILVTVCAITFKFVLLPIRVTGHSMEPTCQDGRAGLVNLLAYAWRAPQRGEIVGIRQAADGPILLKRLIGLPGERIAFHRGQLYINGVLQEEPYLSAPGTGERPEETLGPGMYFATGDNRAVTEEYHIGRNQILGRLLGGGR
jgi:signal peptidase I